MHLSGTAKNAIKTAVAMVLVFYVALRVNWMSPTWAGFVVMSLSMPTVGQSLNLGILRIGGTVLGAAAALVYMGLFPQDRFALIAIVCLHLGFVTYWMMGSKKNAYFWQLTGLTCTIITVAGPGSSSALFERATFRNVETALGVVIVTLVWVFLWPQSDRAALRGLTRKLVAGKMKLFEAIRNQTLQQDSTESVPALQKQQTQLVQQFGASLEAAGVEAYDVRAVRPLLDRFQQLSTNFVEIVASWEESLTEIRQVPIRKVFPELDDVSAELQTRIQEVQNMLEGKPPEQAPEPVSLNVDHTELQALSPFDRAAVTFVKSRFEKLDSLTRSLFDVVRELEGFPRTSPGAAPLEDKTAARKTANFLLPLLDSDQLRASLMVMVALLVGFLTWIFFNPPGHAGFTQLVPSFALAFAKLRVVSPKALLKPMATAIPVGLLIYVFILPHLSVFWELGIVIFLYTFVITYLFPSGVGKIAGLVGMLMTWGISNQQSYNFAAAANTYLFVIMAILVVLASSYITQAPRPEKAFLGLVERYFKSAEFLLSQITFPSEERSNLWQRYRAAYHRREIATLPQKIAARGHFVDPKKFANNGPERIQSLVTSLTLLSHRIAALDQASTVPQAEGLVHELLDHVRQWRFAIVGTFRHWSQDPAAAPKELSTELESRLATFESLITETIDQAEHGKLSEKESETFYRVLASYRGVSDATLAYAGVAASFDWADFREERF